MSSEIKFCKKCSQTGKNMIGSSNQKNVGFGKGYIIGWDDNISICPFCNSTLIDITLPLEDYLVIRKISNYNRQLLEAMIDLHDKDIIEYELKMSQFRAQAEQQKSTENSQHDNVPKCPTCGSTNIQKISASVKLGGAMMFGIFSKTAKSQWKCMNCGSKW